MSSRYLKIATALLGTGLAVLAGLLIALSATQILFKPDIDQRAAMMKSEELSVNRNAIEEVYNVRIASLKRDRRSAHEELLDTMLGRTSGEVFNGDPLLEQRAKEVSIARARAHVAERELARQMEGTAGRVEAHEHIVDGPASDNAARIRSVAEEMAREYRAMARELGAKKVIYLRQEMVAIGNVLGDFRGARSRDLKEVKSEMKSSPGYLLRLKALCSLAGHEPIVLLSFLILFGVPVIAFLLATVFGATGMSLFEKGGRKVSPPRPPVVR